MNPSASTIRPIPYQGSKRKIANDILSYVNQQYVCLYEPFAGSAAISIAAKQRGLARKFFVSDVCAPLIHLWQEIVFNPDEAANRYEEIWSAQFENENHYYVVREEFNRDHDPIKFLYLVARCVKNSIRFNSNGEFNQSPDNRRKGRNPSAMRQQIFSASLLFKQDISFAFSDYEDIIIRATDNDLVYFDPPYLGVSEGRDRRYCEGLNFSRFVENLFELNKKNVPYLISFDGSCGTKKYGTELPRSLMLEKVDILAGRSAQATLNGRDDITVESLYISPALTTKTHVFQRSQELVCVH